MDKTETYIKMSDCPEVQGQWKLAEGDYVHWRDGETELFGWEDADAWTMEEIKENHGGGVWLPLQHQLWDMCETIDKLETGFSALQSICSFHTAVCYDWEMYKLFTSKEQLLLAFYMKEKHSKQWINDKWNVQN